MAESEFSIDIPVNLVITQARAELRQFLEEASRGVSVPVRGGTPSGAPTTAESVAVAEQRAVAVAMERAQGESATRIVPRSVRGPAASLAMSHTGTAGDLFASSQNRVANLQSGLAEVQAARYLQIAQGEAPVYGPTREDQRLLSQAYAPAIARQNIAQRRSEQVDRTWDLAQLAGQKASERRAAQFDRASDAADFQAFKIQERSSARAEAEAAESNVFGPTRADQRRLREAYAPQLRRMGDEEPSGRPGSAGRLSSWLGANSGRGLLALLGAHEINSAIGAIRGADVAEQFARTPEEAFLARAEANVQATSGLYGGSLALPFNLLNTPNSPQRMLREAQEAVEIRSIREQTRQGRNETAANVAYRSGYGVGGRSQAEISRIEAQRTGQVSTIKQEMTDLQNRLDARTPITETAYHTYGGPGGVIRGGGENVLTGDARLAVQQQLKERTDRLADINAQAKFDTEQKKREEATFLRQSTAAEATFRMTARGATSRALERQALSDQYTEARAKAVDLFGAAGGARVDRERAAAFGALEFGYGRSDEDTRHALNLATQVQLLQSSNQPVAAAITAAVGQASLQTRQVLRNGTGGTLAGAASMVQSLRAIGGNLAANVAAPLIQEQQTVYQQQQGIVGQAAVLQMQLDRNPLGAQLAGIAAQRDAYLNSQQFQSLSPAAQGRLRPIVQGYAELQERYARQQDRDRRFEIGDSLDAANRQSRLRQAGGDYRVDAVLDRIVTDTARDARQLERDRDPENAVRRRTLGVNQLREARGDYFRSVNFEEVEGGRIAAGRDRPFDAVERKFRDAEDRIGKSKDGGPAGGGGPPTSGQMTTLIGLIQQFVNRNFVARAGP